MVAVEGKSLQQHQNQKQAKCEMGNANKKPLSEECDADSDSSSDSRPGEIILTDLSDSDVDLNPEDAKVIKNRCPDTSNDVEKHSDGDTKTHEMETDQAGI